MKDAVLRTLPTPTTVSQDLLNNLQESVMAFSNFSQIPITFYDLSGALLWESLPHSKLCNLLPLYNNQQNSCRKNISSSAKISSQLGEAYVFVCQEGFANISMPLILHGVLVGHFIAGPILMGELKESLISKVLQNNPLQGSALNQLVLFLRKMKFFVPKEVSYLSYLFQCCILAPISVNGDYSRLNTQYKEQRKVSEDLQRYKKENKSIHYPYQTESHLIDAAKSGNASMASSLFKKLFDEIILIESGNLSAIKTKVLGICVLLSRSVERSYEGDADSYFYHMNDLNEAKTIGELYDLSSQFIDSFTASASPVSYTGRSQIVKSTLEYIAGNYSGKLQLKTVANLLHTNASYLSTLFRQETGLTFSDYVNQFRIMKSKELLVHTNSSLADIAELVGFDDQSYFSKMFKQVLGITPKQYRKQGG